MRGPWRRRGCRRGGVQRVTATCRRERVTERPMAPRNERIEVTCCAATLCNAAAKAAKSFKCDPFRVAFKTRRARIAANPVQQKGA